MIGKGSFFDLITKTAGNINNVALSTSQIMRSFDEQYKRFKQKSQHIFK